MSRFTLLLLIFFCLVTGACSSRKSKLDRRNLIPEKELTSIITDIYITDGLLTLPSVLNWYPQLDSLSAYKEVIKKHGYTKESMDKTLKYYFIKKPKQLIKIYDQVLAVLSEMESRYEKEMTLLQSKISNRWKGKESFSFPDPSASDTTSFDLTVVTPGTYTLSFTVTLYPDDQSVNPRITAYTCNPDSIETGKRKYIKSINYIKDGRPHSYQLTIKAKNKSDYNLRGKLYDFDNWPDDWGKHLRIEKIFYTYTSAAV
jgi:hypothetical protein